MKRRTLSGVFHASPLPAHLKNSLHRFCVKPPFPDRFPSVFRPVFAPFLYRFFSLI